MRTRRPPSPLRSRGSGGSRLERAPLLAAQSEIALAAGDLDLAEQAAAEVAGTADAFDSAGLRAEGHRCVGAVQLADGRVMEALSALRMAFNEWTRLDVPFEAARTRMLLAQTYAACGDADAAQREETAARACFERLGVLPVRAGRRRPAGLTAREVEVIRVLASGKSNKEIAEELFLSPKTVARHLSNIFAKTGSATRSAATAYAYDNGLMGRTTHPEPGPGWVVRPMSRTRLGSYLQVIDPNLGSPTKENSDAQVRHRA